MREHICPPLGLHISDSGVQLVLIKKTKCMSEVRGVQLFAQKRKEKEHFIPKNVQGVNWE